jgi:hypothetical protein
LDELLERFFFEVRTARGDLYKKNSYISIRHGINRFLENSGKHSDIVNDVQFKKSQLAFKSMLAKLKDEGKGGTDHHPPLETADLRKLSSYLTEDLENPERLQVIITVHV